MLGVSAGGETLPAIVGSLASDIDQTNPHTFVLGLSVTLFLFWVRSGLKPLLMKAGLSAYTASMLAKTGPIFGVVITSLLAFGLRLEAKGMALVGEVSVGLPDFSIPVFSSDALWELFVSAVLISIIGFVESVSVGHTLAAKRRERISPDQELVGLGAANIAASVSGGYPVTGGFARSVVNFDAGAETPAAGIYTAAGIAFAAIFFTPYLAWLPKATLAATIIVAVLSLIDISILKRSWAFARSDFIAAATTIFFTLTMGVETGVACGVFASLALHLYKTTKPHMAVVGEVSGTEHFRNINRHKVVTRQEILSLRIDESLYFANARYVEDHIYSLLEQYPQTRHVVLMCTAVNEIDISALETLESINAQLIDTNVKLHLSEVKGPVMDMLARTHFLDELSGRIFLSQHIAIAELEKELYGDPGWII
ncbi:MAG: SulP family inorganic anion transporter [Pseudomonadales bacterium]